MSSIFDKDTDLIRRLNKKDVKTFSKVYNENWKVLFNISMKYTNRDSERSKDIVQEVFTNLYQKLGNLDDKFSIVGYLAVSVKNIIINQYRKEKVKQKHLTYYVDGLLNKEERSDNKLYEKEMKEYLVKCAHKYLPQKTKEVFLAKFETDLSNKEASEKFNVSIETIKKHYFNACAIIREKIGIHFSEEKEELRYL